MTPERRAEAQQAGSAFHLALIYIGVASIDEAFTLWAQLPESQAPQAVEAWIRSMQTMTKSHRQEARDLAMAYYRLARALHTGRTVSDPWNPDEGGRVTLGTLRTNFAGLVEDAQQYQPRSTKTRDMVGRESEEPDSDRSGDDEVVEVDRAQGSILNVQQRDDADADDIQRSILLVNLNDYRAKRERAQSEAEVTKAAADAATLAAASAQKNTLDGGRATLQSVERRDREAIGFVRVSRTGTPCGFCAMLISRGIFLKYYTEGAATFRRSDGEKYHLNCQCYGEPVFSQEHYDSDPRFDLNRKYSDLWPVVTKGYRGRDAMNAWRRWIERGQFRDEPTSDESSAQVA